MGGRAGAEAVHVLDLTEAVGRATAQNDTGIAFVDNMHLNVEGRRFTAQLLLNLMRQLLPA